MEHSKHQLKVILNDFICCYSILPVCLCGGNQRHHLQEEETGLERVSNLSASRPNLEELLVIGNGNPHHLTAG